MPLTLHKASRKKAKIKIGIFGPSGSGKTYSSLLLARGLTSSWDKIAVIDTENGSADLYSDLGDYNVLTLKPPFSPEAYIEAIRTCKNAGIEVLIIDSISHEWEGKGGILELAEEGAKVAKNSFAIWRKLTPRHNAFINEILQSDMNIICCGRSKQDYVINSQEKNGRTIQVPEKIGLKAVTREGFEYEMTLAFDIMINHYATVSKDRTGIFTGVPEFKIDSETGKKIFDWNQTGVEEIKPNLTADNINAFFTAVEDNKIEVNSSEECISKISERYNITDEDRMVITETFNSLQS